MLPQETDKSRILKMDWTDTRTIPDEVLSLRRMSWYINEWDGPDLEYVLDGLNIFTEVPLACKGTNCVFAKTCPLVKYNTVQRWANNNLPCPLEIVEAFKHFSGYINSLKIAHTDHTSIQVINDLIRMLIHMRRCDLLIREENPLEVMTIPNPRGGKDLENRKPNELLVVQEKLRKDINTAYKNLVASRDAQLKERQINKAGQDATNMISDLIANMQKDDAEELRLKQMLGQEDNLNER